VLEDLERHAAADRLALLGEIHDAHATFAKHSQHVVVAKVEE
jgi:hypothetical protein